MNKGIGYYIRSYLKKNALVLFFELVVVVLLAMVCTMLLGGSPAWLGPVLAFTAYLLAEMRFMMAFVATNLSKDAKEENEKELEEPEEPEDDLYAAPVANEKDADNSYEEYAPPAPILEADPLDVPQESAFTEPTEPFFIFFDEPTATEESKDSVINETLSARDIDDDLDLPIQSSLDLDE